MKFFLPVLSGPILLSVLLEVFYLSEVEVSFRLLPRLVRNFRNSLKPFLLTTDKRKKVRDEIKLFHLSL